MNSVLKKKSFLFFNHSGTESNEKLAKYLIKCGADVTIKSQSNETAYDIAMKTGEKFKIHIQMKLIILLAFHPGFTKLAQILKDFKEKSKSFQILNKFEDNQILEKINLEEVKQPGTFSKLVNIPNKPIDKQKWQRTATIGKKGKLKSLKKYKAILKKHEKIAQFNKMKLFGNKTRATKSN